MMATGEQFVDEVKRFLGDPYVYGGAGPKMFDCSGLVQYALGQLGLTPPRTSEQQWAWVTRIQQADLSPGDLVFSQWPGDDAPPGHVAIYAGGGQIIEAPRPGQSVHQIPLSSGYLRYVTGYGRVPGLATATAAPGAATASQASFLSGLQGWLGQVTGISDVAGMIAMVFGPLSNVMQDVDQALTTAMHAVLWLINPSSWVRILAGLAGGAAALTGAVLVAKAA